MDAFPTCFILVPDGKQEPSLPAVKGFSKAEQRKKNAMGTKQMQHTATHCAALWGAILFLLHEKSIQLLGASFIS